VQLRGLDVAGTAAARHRNCTSTPQPIHANTIFLPVTGPVSWWPDYWIQLAGYRRQDGRRAARHRPTRQNIREVPMLKEDSGQTRPLAAVAVMRLPSHGTELGGLWGAQISKSVHRGQGPR